MKKLRIVFFVAVLLLCAVAAPAPVAYADTSDGVYIGGQPVGISIDVGGLLVESVDGVDTEYGTVYVEGLSEGDIITEIDGTDVRSVADIAELLGEEPATLLIIRNGEQKEVTVRPVVEAYSLRPKLGVKIKDRIYGVGTVTFVAADGSFAALGHEIVDGETGAHIPFSGGHIHACKIIGIKRGERGEAGAILASIRPEKELGTIDCNNCYGVAGKYYDTDFLKGGELFPIASREEVTPGPAKIRTTVEGEPEYFDIEIIKAARHPGRHEKGIVFRVTDKRLLSLTGGILRGMSGSPIVRNGKILGAVTHVFLNDFSKGYGLYADCLNLSTAYASPDTGCVRGAASVM